MTALRYATTTQTTIRIHTLVHICSDNKIHDGTLRNGNGRGATTSVDVFYPLFLRKNRERPSCYVGAPFLSKFNEFSLGDSIVKVGLLLAASLTADASVGAIIHEGRRQEAMDQLG